jgi:hypothetical protein
MTRGDDIAVANAAGAAKVYTEDNDFVALDVLVPTVSKIIAPLFAEVVMPSSWITPH